MVLKLTSDEIREVHQALMEAYAEVLRQLRLEGSGSRELGLELCRRKWKLEALLHQFDHPEDPNLLLEVAPADRAGVLRRQAA